MQTKSVNFWTWAPPATFLLCGEKHDAATTVLWFWDVCHLTVMCSCRRGECDPDYSHVGRQHPAEAAGSEVQKRRPPPNPLQRHIWCVSISIFQLKPVSCAFYVTPSCPNILTFFLVDAFSHIIANEGVGTLWNGTLPSLILVLNPAVQFMIYEAMKRKAGKGGQKVRECWIYFWHIIWTSILQDHLCDFSFVVVLQSLRTL